MSAVETTAEMPCSWRPPAIAAVCYRLGMLGVVTLLTSPGFVRGISADEMRAKADPRHYDYVAVVGGNDGFRIRAYRTQGGLPRLEEDVVLIVAMATTVSSA